MTFFSKTLADRTAPGTRQAVEEQSQRATAAAVRVACTQSARSSRPARRDRPRQTMFSTYTRGRTSSAAS